MKKIELLSPVGDFECLKAAVQNGADAVYLGVSDFNARSSAKNFNLYELQEAINYAHLRCVKVFLTLNILIKNSELNSAIELASKAYEYGIDGIIVQDLGFANILINTFPDLPIHASTQMTCNNLQGVNFLENLGFKRIVLARELSLDEIKFIKSNSSCQIEVFSHGALCICYSGQCLYSSLIGGRSGNRGKCAQGCRLPYTLLENSTSIDNGYLLSPKDLCSLELLPNLIDSGIDSLKIEGRMKSPEYVATVTRIYRKYIDKIYNNEQYLIDEQDKKDLLQVFNRGGFSTGHLENKSNRDFIFKEKPNNMGLYIGNVSNYNSNKGHISLSLNEKIKLGDTITFEKENSKYVISELMDKNINIKSANIHDKVTIGRMKGNIKVGDKIYKLASKSLSDFALKSYMSEFKKQPINATLEVVKNKPISLEITDANSNNIIVYSKECPEIAKNLPITSEKLTSQLNKLTDTPFYFENIKINLDDNLFVPHISTINELRRTAINKYSELLINKYLRESKTIKEFNYMQNNSLNKEDHKICLLLNILNLDFNYSELNNIDKLYIPLKYFYLKDFSNIIKDLTSNFNVYIYMPNILKANFINLAKNTIEDALNLYNISGFVISNIGQSELLKEYKNNFEFIGNFNLNVFNNVTSNSFNFNSITISPELNKEEINQIASNLNIESEFVVYGNIPLMTSSYCLLGKANKCYPDCIKKCQTNKKYYLKDRMGFLFRILPNNIQTITTIFNSKITSIDTLDLPFIDNYRIDILDENISEINNIISKVKSKTRLEGKDYTNGNLNRSV